MEHIKHSRLAQIVLVLFLLCVAFGLEQAVVLHKAHSTLANYAAFRGCTSITSQTPTSVDCTLSSGQTITLVEINGKWYLEGDGPGVW